MPFIWTTRTITLPRTLARARSFPTSLNLPMERHPTDSFPIGPRLYYHRHFMLTEFLGNGPEELRPLIGRAFARNLCRETGAIRVNLAQVTHETALISDILRGRTLNESSLFSESSLGNYTADELNHPFRPAETDSKTSPVDSTGEWNAPPLSTDDPKEFP